jgi:uncharacterized protein YceK
MKNAIVVLLVLLSTGGCKLLGKLAKGKGGGGPSAGAVVSDEAKAAMSRYATGYNALLDDPKELIKEYYDSAPLVAPAGGAGNADIYALPLD